MIDLLRMILRDAAADAAAGGGGAAGGADDKGAAAAGADKAAGGTDSTDKGAAKGTEGAAAAGGDKSAAADDKGAAGKKSLLDSAGEKAKTPEEKAAAEKVTAENKRLLDTADDKLSKEELEKKQALVKAQKDADDKANKEGKAPEKYDFKDLKLPDGMTLDQAMIDKFIPAFKELDLSQDKVNKLVGIYAEQKVAEAKVAEDIFQKFVEGLRDETLKSLGANAEEEMAYAAKARDRFTTPALMEKLNVSGFSEDKDLMAMFIMIGKTISEDKKVEGTEGPGTEKSAAALLFPSMAADKK